MFKVGSETQVSSQLSLVCGREEQAAGAGVSGYRIYRVPPDDVRVLRVPSGSGE